MGTKNIKVATLEIIYNLCSRFSALASCACRRGLERLLEILLLIRLRGRRLLERLLLVSLLGRSLLGRGREWIGVARHAHRLRDQPVWRLASVDGLDIGGGAGTHPTARRLDSGQRPGHGRGWRPEVFLVSSLVFAVLVPGRLLGAGPALRVRGRIGPRRVRLLHPAQTGIQPGAGWARGFGRLASARPHRARVGPHRFGFGQDAGGSTRTVLGDFRAGLTGHARHCCRASGGRLRRRWRAWLARRADRAFETLEPGRACDELCV